MTFSRPYHRLLWVIRSVSSSAVIPIDPFLRRPISSSSLQVKAAAEESSNGNSDPTASTTSKSKSRKKATTAKKRSTAAASKQVYQPNPLWREQLEGIREMRKEENAAVDLFGCGTLGKVDAQNAKHMRFQTLIASMLSSQTTDVVNDGAMARLRAACGAGVTIEGLERLGEEQIAAIIKPVSFNTVKAKNILRVCAILKEKYDYDVPRTFEELLDLPGVGPKMSILVMAYGWGEIVGVCVDTHVHRISNRLGWVDTWNNGKGSPEKTRKSLESWMPRDHWFEVNPLLVGFGQQICHAISPKCHLCQITHICSVYEDVKKSRPTITQQRQVKE